MRHLALTLLALASSMSFAHDAHQPHQDDHHQQSLGSHQHGLAQLNIAQVDATLAIQLISPTADLFGFEHPPKNAEQQTYLEQVEAQLSRALTLFSPSSKAQCSLTRLELNNPLQAASEHAHSDMEINYQLSCQQPSKLKELNVGALFEQFPSLHKLQLQLINQHGQSAAELTPKHPELSL